ncbi:hypothetical protein ABVK25_006781 [Lepraria finkii]|uniref:Uncharacterized protein n=1 Tax=Lepraria finkii TaxID=1340010 RepID=A0ABR4B4N4_9LECA
MRRTEGPPWLEQRIWATSKMNMVLADLTSPQNGLGFMVDVFMSAEGWHPGTAGVARVVDGCGVQMLRDVFYIVTGVKTDDAIVSLEEKSSQTDGIPLSGDEELG